MNISPDKLKEFTVLFEEFINSYPNTAKGIKHISFYSQQRESGRRNYQAILEAKEAGEDITDRVLLQLLPYEDTENNREQGAWIHTSYLTPSILKNVQDDIRLITVHNFIRIINDYTKNPDNISNISVIVNNCLVTKNWLVDFISPILNALQPIDFMLINKKSISVINYFADTNNSHKLIDYPAINKVAWQLIKNLSSIMDRFDLPALRQDDLFDMFCHWLAAEKKYNFKSGSVENNSIIMNSKNNTHKEKSLEKIISERENLIPEIHFESCFPKQLFEALYTLKKQKFRNNNINKYNNVIIQPFLKICEVISNRLPIHIKQKFSLINNAFEYNIDKNNQLCLIYKISSLSFIYDHDIKIEFDIINDFYYFSIGATIRIESQNDLLKNKLLDNIHILNENYQYIVSKYLYKIKLTSLANESEKQYLIENFKDIKNIEFNHKNLPRSQDFDDYSVINQNVILTIEEVVSKSKSVLFNNIIEIISYFYLLILVVISDNPKQEIEEHLKIWNPKCKLEKYVDTTYIEKSQLKTWIKSITRKKQAIFYGSPGTGKTFIAENIAQYLIGGGDGFYELIQFHPAYSYEDFIQGIRPQTDSGQLSYSLVPGRFLEFCRQAAACKDKCVLIIDEINRANLAEVFGELMYLLEYREQEICLAGSQDKFKIPDNVYLIGTMNTADRSIALVDFALRRRFAFIKIAPNYNIITKFHQQHTKLEVTGLIAVLKEINNLIEDENYYLGVSFFLIETLAEDLENIWQMEIEPYLQEYFGDRLEEIKDYHWENVKDRIAIYKDISE